MDETDTKITIGLLFGIIGLLMIILALFSIFTVELSKKTANEICYNITGVEGVTGRDDGQFNLVCTTPNFESKKRIIIRDGSKVDNE